jgi:hypothetical protein
MCPYRTRDIPIPEAKLNAVAHACDVHPELVLTAGLTGAQIREGIELCSKQEGRLQTALPFPSTTNNH